MPEPLPSNLSPHIEYSKEIKDAYSKILKIEQDTSAMILKSTTNSLQMKLIYIRVLGYLIQEGPTMKAREYIAGVINRCHGEEEIEEHGKFYCSHFIYICMSPLPLLLYSF